MPSRIDTLLAGCRSWESFRELVANQKTSKEKGDFFERLTQLYLQSSPIYKSKIKHVWWCNNGELPEHIRKKLNLPTDDEGIDLICETFDGEYWSVQSKYRSNSSPPLPSKELATFQRLSFVIGKNISLGLIVHTQAKKIQKSHLMGSTVELGLQDWLDINDAEWEQILDVCRGNLLQPPEKRTPRKYQGLAIKKAKKHFNVNKNKRGKLIMPCGTGKSLISYWITQALHVKTIIVAVPSIALIKQSLKDWTSEYLAEGIQPEWLAVCSDDDVGKMKEADSTVATVYEAGIPTTTNPYDISKFIKKKSTSPKVIFTTYQSSQKLANACKDANLTIDLLIADEAHKTVGRRDKKFATLLFDENIKIRTRLFMTATERTFRQGTENIVTMNDTNIYGKTFYEMSFKQAIDDDIICDYKILTMVVSAKEVSNLISQNEEINAQLHHTEIETDSHTLASGIAIEKAFESYGIKHAISFHRSIKRAKDFTSQQAAFGHRVGSKLKIKNRNVSSKYSAGQRSQILKKFTEDDRSLITNARCLTEGVDIPSIDCVAFIDPKKSIVDIVQAAGRAMRQSKGTGKKYGYILLPIIIPDGYSLEKYTETTDFKSIARILTVLSTQDSRIVEELKQDVSIQKQNSEKTIIIDKDIISKLDTDYSHFYETINLKLWEKVSKANYKSFMDARKFVRKLKLKSGADWIEFSRSKDLPPDIPADPRQYYLMRGWTTLGDFLGTDYIAHKNRKYLPYIEAQKIISDFKLQNQKEWNKFTKSKDFPMGVHKSPDRYYKEWIDLGVWLGTNYVATKRRNYKTFEECRTYAQTLNLKINTDWAKYAKDGKIKTGFPADPSQYYLMRGWTNWGDFLGTGNIASQKRIFTSWPDAKKFARKQELTSSTEWINACSNFPDNIHKKPHEYYKEFKGWPDFLGYRPRKLTKGEAYFDFDSAREFLRTKGFSSRDDFKEWCKTSGRPLNIPTNINRHYDKHKNWKGIKDFLGY